jgi:hypothetical protein
MKIALALALVSQIETSTVSDLEMVAQAVAAAEEAEMRLEHAEIRIEKLQLEIDTRPTITPRWVPWAIAGALVLGCAAGAGATIAIVEAAR